MTVKKINNIRYLKYITKQSTIYAIFNRVSSAFLHYTISVYEINLNYAYAILYLLFFLFLEKE